MKPADDHPAAAAAAAAAGHTTRVERAVGCDPECMLLKLLAPDHKAALRQLCRELAAVKGLVFGSADSEEFGGVQSPAQAVRGELRFAIHKHRDTELYQQRQLS